MVREMQGHSSRSADVRSRPEVDRRLWAAACALILILSVPVSAAEGQDSQKEKERDGRQAQINQVVTQLGDSLKSSHAQDVQGATKALREVLGLPIAELMKAPEEARKALESIRDKPAELDQKIKSIRDDLSTNGSNPWCADALTICTSRHRASFNGVRFVAEPRLGNIIETGANRIESSGFGNLSLLGFETDLWGRAVGLQLHVVLPASVTLQAKSPLVAEGRLESAEAKVGVDYGLGGAVTLFDGVIAIGYLRLKFDSRDFKNPLPSETHKGSVFITVQPIAGARAAIKAIK